MKYEKQKHCLDSNDFTIVAHLSKEMDKLEIMKKLGDNNCKFIEMNNCIMTMIGEKTVRIYPNKQILSFSCNEEKNASSYINTLNNLLGGCIS